MPTSPAAHAGTVRCVGILRMVFRGAAAAAGRKSDSAF